jgi:DNA-binding NarL/FixJ family response regulator
MSAILQRLPDATATSSVRGSDVVLATADPAWAAIALAALEGDALGLRGTRRIDAAADVPAELARGARLWIVDEDLATPLLAHRRLEPRSALPDMLVRFSQFSTARVVAMIESGARGCLPPEACAAEATEAVRAVLSGELWLSRRLFSAVLDHMQATSRGRDSADADADDGLTQRQREIVRYVGRGLSNKQIGRILGISPTTVKTHLHNIFERLGVGGRTMLALRANESRAH